MVAGDISRVMSVASIRMDALSPKPSSATMTIPEMEKAKKTTSITAAAPRTTSASERIEVEVIGSAEDIAGL